MKTREKRRQSLAHIFLASVILLIGLGKQWLVIWSNKPGILTERCVTGFVPSVFWSLVLAVVAAAVYRSANRRRLPVATRVYGLMALVAVLMLPVAFIFLPRQGPFFFEAFCSKMEDPTRLDHIVLWANNVLVEPSRGDYVPIPPHSLPEDLYRISPSISVKPDAHIEDHPETRVKFIAVNYYMSRSKRVGILIGSEKFVLPTNGLEHTKILRKGVLAFEDYPGS